MGAPELQVDQAGRGVAIEQIDACLAEARHRHGYASPLAAYYLQIRLAALLESSDVGECAVEIAATLRELGSLLFQTRRFLSGAAPAAFPQAIAFPENAYAQHYARFASAHRTKVAAGLQWTPEHRSLFHRFIYAVGPRGQFRYFTEPQSIEISITKRNDPARFPFHPMLAVDFDLKVLVAGEISFVWPAASYQPVRVYANNVSGHYKPSAWTASALDACLRRALLLDDSVDMITIANDGARISGPLAALMTEFADDDG